MILIKFKPLGNYKELLITNTKNGHQLGLLPGYGAALNKFIYRNQFGFHNAVLPYLRTEDFVKLYRNVILSPFVNRIKEGRYSYDNINYQLPVNDLKTNNAIHGFLFNKEFKVTDMKRGVDDCEIFMQYHYEATEEFPFGFIQDVIYKWDGADYLEITTVIHNTSDFIMPYSIGWHPYFTLGDSISDNTIHFNAKNKYILNDIKIPTGERQEYDQYKSAKKIGDTTFDDCFEMKENAVVKISSEQLQTSYTIKLIEDSLAFRFLQIYIPPNRRSIAIEPMSAAPDSLNNLIGLQNIHRNEKLKSTYSISIEYK